MRVPRGFAGCGIVGEREDEMDMAVEVAGRSAREGSEFVLVKVGRSWEEEG